MTDETLATVKVFDLAEERLRSANARLEQCKRLIIDFGANLSQRGWQVRFSDHAMEPARGDMVTEDETFSLQGWPSREEIQRLLRERCEAVVARQAAVRALPEELRERLAPRSPRKSK
jgi:hypothetical protein